MKTEAFLNSNHGEIIPSISRGDFKSIKMINVSDLWANQEEIDSKVLNYKLKGNLLSDLYVVEINGKNILLDGHHTVIAKYLNGIRKVKTKYLKITSQL